MGEGRNTRPWREGGGGSSACGCARKGEKRTARREGEQAETRGPTYDWHRGSGRCRDGGSRGCGRDAGPGRNGGTAIKPNKGTANTGHSQAGSHVESLQLPHPTPSTTTHTPKTPKTPKHTTPITAHLTQAPTTTATLVALDTPYYTAHEWYLDPPPSPNRSVSSTTGGAVRTGTGAGARARPPTLAVDPRRPLAPPPSESEPSSSPPPAEGFAAFSPHTSRS
jgi:hypothetical protein